MRKFIDIINENSRPTATKTDRADLSSLTDLGGQHTGSLAPAGGTNVAHHRAANLPGSTASGAETARAWSQGGAAMAAARGMHAPGNLLRDLQAAGAGVDDISDAEARANSSFDTTTAAAALQAPNQPMLGHVGHTLPKTPENLPVVINQAVMAHGDPEIENHFDPKWHRIPNLPGYSQGPIRQVARMVFKEFTNTPIEDINMMCDLLNPPRDVQKMASLIARYGVQETDPTFDWSETIPAYAAIAGPTAETRLYRCAGFQFVIMRDAGGNYIYGWPADDGRIVNMRNQGQLPPPA